MGALQKLCSFSNQALLIALSLAPRKLGCTHAVLAVRSEDEALKWGEKKKNIEATTQLDYVGLVAAFNIPHQAQRSSLVVFKQSKPQSSAASVWVHEREE